MLYTIKLRRYKQGKNGKTLYRFKTRIAALWFAAGYQAGCGDCGNPDLYVSVEQCGDYVSGHCLVADSPELERMVYNVIY